MAVTQTLLSSTPPFGNRDGEIVVQLDWASTYVPAVLDLQALGIPHLNPAQFSKLVIPRVAGGSDGKDFALQNTLAISGVTTADPGVVTTVGNHNLTTGDTVTIASVGGATQANGTNVVTVLSATTFSIPVDVTGTYTSGGTVTVTPVMDWAGVCRLYNRGTSTEASSTVTSTVVLPIRWLKGTV